MATRATRFFNLSRNFGSIVPVDGGKGFIDHVSAVDEDGPSPLAEWTDGAENPRR